jgi:hypothetical protein
LHKWKAALLPVVMAMVARQQEDAAATGAEEAVVPRSHPEWSSPSGRWDN